MSNPLEQAIRRTIAYGKKYGVLYSAEDISQRLISEKNYQKIVVKRKIKPTKKKWYQTKLKMAKNLGKQLARRFKTIRLIGVTGSVAAEYPKRKDDIDLMVVTKKNNLWITRLGIRIWVWFKRIPHRKYDREEVGDEFCFNLWLEDGALELPKNKQTLKNAMDLILMKPVVDKKNTYEKLVISNIWAKKYVATGYAMIISKFKSQKSEREEKTNFLERLINLIAYGLQYLYMRRRFSGEKVDLKRAFFHPEK